MSTATLQQSSGAAETLPAVFVIPFDGLPGHERGLLNRDQFREVTGYPLKTDRFSKTPAIGSDTRHSSTSEQERFLETMYRTLADISDEKYQGAAVTSLWNILSNHKSPSGDRAHQSEPSRSIPLYATRPGDLLHFNSNAKVLKMREKLPMRVRSVGLRDRDSTFNVPGIKTWDPFVPESPDDMRNRLTFKERSSNSDKTDNILPPKSLADSLKTPPYKVPVTFSQEPRRGARHEDSFISLPIDRAALSGLKPNKLTSLFNILDVLGSKRKLLASRINQSKFFPLAYPSSAVSKMEGRRHNIYQTAQDGLVIKPHASQFRSMLFRGRENPDESREDETKEKELPRNDKRSRYYDCDLKRVTFQMLREYLNTGKLCGSYTLRFRFGIGK